jgi:hypothetical protein
VISACATRPRLVTDNTGPAPALAPRPRAVPDGVRAEGENIRTKLTLALAPLSSCASTDVALSRSKAELFALATALQKLARRL